MHHLDSLLSRFSLQVKIPYQKVSYCTRQRPCFHLFVPTRPKRFKYRNNACLRYIGFIYFSKVLIRFKTVTMQPFFYLFLCSSNSFQIPPECMLQNREIACFHFFSAFPNRFKYLKSACFKEIVFNIVSAVPNRFKCRQNARFRDIVFQKDSLQFQIVPNSVRMHALETLFNKKILCSSKQFQIVSENMLQRHFFQKTFLFFSEQFHIPSECMNLETLFSIFSLQFQIVQIPSECMRQRHFF